MSKNKKNMPINIPAVSSFPFADRFEKQRLWHLALLVLLPFFIYIKVTGFELIEYDDVAIIYNNFDIIGHIKNIGKAFTTDAFLSPHGDFYRPVQTVSYMLDALVSGEKPWFYHLSSLLYHLLTVVSLYFLLGSMGARNLTALFVALLFSIHPLLTSSVSWIPARGDVLAGLFGTLCFMSFNSYFKTHKKIFLLLHFICFALAVFSKEVSVLMPLLLLFHYFVILKERYSFQNLSFFIISWFIVLVCFFMLRTNVLTGAPPDFILGISPFISNLPAIPILVTKAFIPARLSPMPLFENVFILPGVLLLAGMIFFSVRNAARKKWIPLMGLVWFFLFLLPPLFFKLFFSQYIVEYYEHRSYLPMVGLSLALAFFINDKLFNSNRKILIGIPVTVIIVFAFMASLYSDNFKNSMAFFGRAAELNNPGAATKRGELYSRNRDYINALADFENAITVSDGSYAYAFYNRGKVRSEYQKDHKAAEADFTQSIRLADFYTDAYIARANERIAMQNFPGAFADITEAKKKDSLNAKLYYTLGTFYMNVKDFPHAVEGFSRSITLDSSYSEAYNNRGVAFNQMKRYPEALKDYGKAIELFPQYMNAYFNKAIVYYELQKPDMAIHLFDTTLSLANNFYFGYFYRGMAKKQKNDMTGACSDWKQSVDLGFTMAQDTINKYCK